MTGRPSNRNASRRTRRLAQAAPGSLPDTPADGARETPASAWRGAAPEIVIAVIVTVATAAAGYAVSGTAGATLVVVGAAAIGLAALRIILPPSDTTSGDDYLPGPERVSMPFAGYWRKRSGLAEGTRSLAAYDAELRGTLQNLLAARLAERHGISLHEDRGAAHRLLCADPRDEILWYWVDPARPAVRAAGQLGIPPRTLARLIDRLERL